MDALITFDFITTFLKFLLPDKKVQNIHIDNRIDKQTLVNVKNVTINIHSPDSSDATRSKGALPERCSVTIGTASNSSPRMRRDTTKNKTVIFDASVSTTDDNVAVKANPPLALSNGTYIRFDDPEWWANPSHCIDVAPNVRVVSITDVSRTFPHMESDVRKITIECNGRRMTIRGTNVHFNNVHARGKLMDRFTTPPNREWTLHRVRPDQATKLQMNSCHFILEYARDFAECAWYLVNHHPTRGDEAYILLKMRSAP